MCACVHGDGGGGGGDDGKSFDIRVLGEGFEGRQNNNVAQLSADTAWPA